MQELLRERLADTLGKVTGESWRVDQEGVGLLHFYWAENRVTLTARNPYKDNTWTIKLDKKSQGSESIGPIKTKHLESELASFIEQSGFEF
jgi:hypothetical protein